jgi:Arc/MetJ-type ribon-helix-helix transcriptional regulator
MVRTQVSLTEEQHRFLTSLARQSGVSLSTLVREAVGLLKQSRTPPAERALALLGAFEADRPDISVHHDEYLTSGMGTRKTRPRR